VRTEEPQSNFGTLVTKSTIAPEISKFIGFGVATTSPTIWKDPINGARRVSVWDELKCTAFYWKFSPCNVVNMINMCRILNLKKEYDEMVFHDYEEISVVVVDDTPKGTLGVDEQKEEPESKRVKKHISEWTSSEVGKWVKTLTTTGISVDAVALLFESNDINGGILLKLDSTDLKEMGINKLSDRVSIMNGVATLNKQE